MYIAVRLLVLYCEMILRSYIVRFIRLVFASRYLMHQSRVLFFSDRVVYPFNQRVGVLEHRATPCLLGLTE